MNIKSSLLLTLSLIAGLASLSSSANAALDFSNPTYGYEIGYERQLETDQGEDFVERTFGRALATAEWQLHKNKRGDDLTLELKAGGFAGKYKGALKYEDEFGSLTTFRGGVTTEALGLYTFNTGRVDPSLGLSGVFEANGGHRRSEWQADAVAALKFDLTNNKDLTLMYKKTLAHGMYYFKEENSYRQDDGYLIALIGTKHMPDNTTRSIKLAYEDFEIGDIIQLPNTISYEPDTVNILLSYSRTF